MSHGIMEIDRGVVMGTTWHGMSQYECQAIPVSIEQVLKVLNYPLEKVQLYRQEPGCVNEFLEVDGAFAIVRTDHNKVVAENVGSNFVAMNNSVMANYLNEFFLSKFPDLCVESTGTLFGGAVSFINIKVAEFKVKGDSSPTESRLMYYNPIGRGAYQVCAHDTRIVCNNTLKMAAGQGAANKTLSKFSHTKGAEVRIENAMEALAEFRLGLKAHIEVLDRMAEVQVKSADMKKFLNELFPVKNSKDPATRTANKWGAITQTFESGQELIGDTRTSRYGLLNAVTSFVDHHMGENQKRNDRAAMWWDGMVGYRSSIKTKAFDLLSNKLQTA